jgi:hypothetical protein
MFLSRRSLLRCGIARYPCMRFSFLLSAVTGAPVRFVCNIANVTPSGIFYPSLDLRPSTTARTVPTVSVSSRLLAASSTITTFASPWSSRFKAQSIGARHPYPRTCTTTSILLSVRQHHYNHCPYSEPAIRKVVLYCLAHHYGVV